MKKSLAQIIAAESCLLAAACVALSFSICSCLLTDFEDEGLRFVKKPPDPNLKRDLVALAGMPEPRLDYLIYIPEKAKNEGKKRVVACVGGWGSSGSECFTPKWKAFAEELGVAIISPVFKPPSDESFAKKTGYQYPAAWSGAAFNQLLKDAEAKYGVKTDDLLLFGMSAGAQFCHRYALLFPDKVKAAAVHAPGSYTHPTVFSITRFFVTVGELDKDRLNAARLFVEAAKKQNIDVAFKIIPGLGHTLSEVQVSDSHEFFKKASIGNNEWK